MKTEKLNKKREIIFGRRELSRRITRLERRLLKLETLLGEARESVSRASNAAAGALFVANYCKR